MNAGTHLGESKDRLVQVEVVPLVGALAGKDSKPVIYGPDELKFEYRRNLFVPSGGLVWAAEWRIDQAEPAQVKALINELLARRKSTQPVNLPSCGSVFKNPKQSGLSAWQVIDKLGLRGHTVGRAQFSEKHSNFIVNLGGASAADVLALIRLAKTRAESELGVRLEEEVVLLGDHNRDQSSL
jgi:UDP-N-acetylmuramate dehydrogenase